MKNLSWKSGIALLTFFVGTALALIWITPGNKKPVTAKAELRPSEFIKLENKISELSSDNKNPVKTEISKINAPIRYIKNGGEFCEKYILRKIEKEKSADSRMVKLKNFNPEDETLSPNVKKWLENMRWEEMLAAELRNNQQKALLLRSTNYGATGLATNLENWHIEIDSFYSETFWSFSKNPNLVFWDKDGMLNYYSIV